MKVRLSVLFAVALAFTLGAFAVAEEKGKEVNLKGNITCAKCELKKEKKCATVIVVKKDADDKGTVYYFDAASDKKYHKDICKEGKKGTVKGTCKKVGDKLVLTVEELKYED